ncbi:hypothetical protein VTI74DRAFT_1332 [Chaetomium olivicolor]
MPTASQPAMEIRRKPLPAPPSQFRLGEGGEPWSTWSMPDGYDPENDDQEDHGTTQGQTADRNSTTYATNPTMVSTFSPEPTSPARARDAETGRDRELGALSAALMTVDNGFENQWWYQGQRENVAADDEPTTPTRSPIHRRSTEPMSAVTASPEHVAAGVVSPMTEATFSPASVPGFLHRSMSTRSEELWFHERPKAG